MTQLSLFGFFSLAPLQAYKIICVPAMAGRKSATIAGRRIFMSPAMFTLYQDSESTEEQVQLLKNIPVYIIGEKLKTIKMEAVVYGKA